MIHLGGWFKYFCQRFLNFEFEYIRLIVQRNIIDSFQTFHHNYKSNKQKNSLVLALYSTPADLNLDCKYILMKVSTNGISLLFWNYWAAIFHWLSLKRGMVNGEYWGTREYQGTGKHWRINISCHMKPQKPILQYSIVLQYSFVPWYSLFLDIPCSLIFPGSFILRYSLFLDIPSFLSIRQHSPIPPFPCSSILPIPPFHISQYSPFLHSPIFPSPFPDIPPFIHSPIFPRSPIFPIPPFPVSPFLFLKIAIFHLLNV